MNIVKSFTKLLLSTSVQHTGSDITDDDDIHMCINYSLDKGTMKFNVNVYSKI